MTVPARVKIMYGSSPDAMFYNITKRLDEPDSTPEITDLLEQLINIDGIIDLREGRDSYELRIGKASAFEWKDVEADILACFEEYMGAEPDTVEVIQPEGEPPTAYPCPRFGGLVPFLSRLGDVLIETQDTDSEDDEGNEECDPDEEGTL